MSTEKENLISDSISADIVRITEEIANKYGAKNVNVRRVITEMGVTNRVFYNRFHNVGEVLEIIYANAVSEMKKCLKSEYDRKTQFFEYVTDVSVKVLIATYEVKKEFSKYLFEFDSHSEENRIWWLGEIKKIVDDATENGHIKATDSDMLSYTVWCFIRGYCADAINRNLTKEEAVKNFKFGLGCLIDGLKS